MKLSVIERLAALALAVALLLSIAGCGNDGDEILQPPDEGPPRRTPAELLTEYFPNAYAMRDTALYAAMLDSGFRFEFLDADADSLRDFLDSADTWNRERDIGSTNFMFRHPSVTDVTLNIFVSNQMPVPSNGCEDCVRVETTVTLRVTTVPVGNEPFIWAVNSPQTFLVRKDASDTTQWVLVRQVDSEAFASKAGTDAASATESKSWGNVKSLYTGSLTPVEPDRSTPEALLTNYFETVYSSQDSALYARILHPEFRFSFLLQDADSLREFIGAQNYWGPALDVRSTSRMFRDSTVTGITLNIGVNSNDEFVGGGCPGCRQLETTVTLRIATTGDGTEPLVYAIDSPQSFVTAPDPARPGKWILFWQIDRPRSAPKYGDAATESASWGGLKGLFVK